jgi:hypothetical protein
MFECDVIVAVLKRHLSSESMTCRLEQKCM